MNQTVLDCLLRRNILFNGSKKKSKGSQSNGILAAEVPKVSLRVGSSSVPKVKKSSHLDNNTSKSEVEDFKSQKDFVRAGDRYRRYLWEIGRRR
jgi:hypothetical protein